MDYDLVIELSPLFLLKSIDEEKQSPNNDNKKQLSRELGETQSHCISGGRDGVCTEEVFFTDTHLLTPDLVGEESVLKSDRSNNAKQESTRILDIIKYSPKFLRKKYTKQPNKNVSPSPEESKCDLPDELSQKYPENLENSGSASPKMGFRKKFLLTVNSKDITEAETMKTLPTITTKSSQESAEFGSSKGRKNWRKVKAALQRMNDSGDPSKSVIASSEENIPEAEKLRFKSSSVQAQDDDESDEDVHQRFKAFLNSSEKKPKTPRSPRLQLRSRFSFWPKGGETAIQEENGVVISSPLSCNQYPVLKSRMYLLGRRRCSAPEAVLRREAEAFALMKTTKDVRNNSQNNSLKHKKANHGIQAKPYDYREHEVRQKMRSSMEKHLKNLTEYCPEVCSQLNSTISDEITEYLHSIDSEDEQKRIVCLVYIGAVKEDGIHAAVRCMWSPSEDRVVVSDYQNNSLYALAVVFAAS